MKKTAWLLVFLLIVPAALAGQGHMKLLAVREVNGSYEGSTADLFLETRPGSGRVFLETFPLTKMDTQISTRFAKEIACNYFEMDCDNYDFIYTIKSTSSIVGGPSAGAAIAALTTAVVKEIEIENSMTVTGTINSGGIIGPVGGLKAKIEAAAEQGIKVVMIPQGTKIQKTENQTIDLKEFGKEKGVLVLEATDLNELLLFFSGKQLRSDNYEISVDEEYFEIMKGLGDLLCDRTAELQDKLGDYEIKDREEKEKLENKTIKGRESLAEGNYYSAASFCFGANVQLRSFIYEKENLSQEEIEQKALRIEKAIRDFEKEVKEKELETITDLQTYGIVIERLSEGRENLESLRKTNNTYYLAFAEERLFSAQSWSNFFAMSGKEFKLDESSLEQSCLEKIQEAKERYQYVSLFIVGDIVDLTKEIEKEEAVYESGDYKYCLIRASQTKAEANAILSSIGVGEEQIDELVNNKLTAVERSLARTISKGAFPILGYSYYQYANSLRDDSSLSLIYAEYALELGNLEIYFEEKPEFEGVMVQPEFWIFIFGGIFGMAAVLLIYNLTKKKDEYKTPRTTRKQSGGKKR